MSQEKKCVWGTAEYFCDSEAEGEISIGIYSICNQMTSVVIHTQFACQWSKQAGESKHN